MMYLRKITGTSGHYLVALPAGACRRDQIRPGSSITLHVRVGDQFTHFPARVLTHARGLHLTIPRPWRLSEGLSVGDPVMLLERAPRLFELQIIPGASEKELQRRGEIVMRMKIEQARAELDAARRAGYHEGYALGRMHDLGEHFRQGDCFNVMHSRYHTGPPSVPRTTAQDLPDEPARE